MRLARNLLYVVPAVVLTACGDKSVNSGGAAFADLREVGFSTPECVVHDPDADVYLVSNVHGNPFQEDAAGYISRVDAATGKMVEHRWIEGGRDGVVLNAPKGMAIVRGLLFVADLTVLRSFNLETGKPVDVIEVPDATFLNGVAAGPGGTVYVSDSGFDPGFKPNGTDAIWKYDELGALTKVASGADLGQPNGVHFGTDELFVVTWGSGKFGFLTEDGKMQGADLPKKQLDGVIRTDDGRWLVSSWEAGCVYVVSPDGSAEVVVDELDAPAAIGWDAKRQVVLIPLFNEDALLARGI